MTQTYGKFEGGDGPQIAALQEILRKAVFTSAETLLSRALPLAFPGAGW